MKSALCYGIFIMVSIAWAGYTAQGLSVWLAEQQTNSCAPELCQ
jgi:hypothetical protein